MEGNAFVVSLSLMKMNCDMAYRGNQLSMIVSIIFALLNSQGGDLNIEFEDPTSDKKRNGVLRTIEQRLVDLMGPCVFRSKVKILQRSVLGIVMQVNITVHPSQFLCTVDYHLYLPTQAQAVLVASWHPQETVKAILNRAVPDFQQQTIYQDYILNTKVSFTESESNSIQFKQLKSDKSKCVSLADRMTNKSNKLGCYISAFCNKIGGKILYGVRDDGIIQGEKINGKGQEEITRKVTKMFDKMIWSNGKLEKGKHWNIAFKPVKDERNNYIRSLFVIEISVEPLPGGVFTQEPDSYYVEQGKVKKMSFEQWKFRFLHPDLPRTSEVVPNHLCRIGWSSVKSQKHFYLISGSLLMYGNKDDFENFNKFSKIARIVYSGAELLIWGEKVRYAYKKGHFEEAESLFSEFENGKLPLVDVEDLVVMELRAVYLKMEIARAKGDYEESYNIAKEGLQLAESAPAGIFTAYFYADVAYLEGVLSTKTKDQARKTSLRYSASCHYIKAIQYVQASGVEQEFNALIADIQQKVRLSRAMTKLRVSDHGANFSDATPSDIKEAKTDLICYSRLCIEEAFPTKFREICYLSAQADLRLRQWWQENTQRQITGQEYETPVLLKDAYEMASKAIELSRTFQFEELFIHANNSVAVITEMMIKLNFVSSPSAAKLRLQKYKTVTEQAANEFDHL